MPVPLLIMGKDAIENIPHITDLDELLRSRGRPWAFSRCENAAAHSGVIVMRPHCHRSTSGGSVSGDSRYYEIVVEFRFGRGTK